MPDLKHFRRNYMDADDFMDKYELEGIYELPDVSSGVPMEDLRAAWDAGKLISIHDGDYVSIGWRSVNVLSRVIVSKPVHAGSKGWL